MQSTAQELRELESLGDDLSSVPRSQMPVILATEYYMLLSHPFWPPQEPEHMCTVVVWM